MNLIKRIYEEDFSKNVDGVGNISISYTNAILLDYYLKKMHFSKNDLYYADVIKIIELIVGRFNDNNKTVLSNFKTNLSVYGNDRIGSISFDIENDDKNKINYYSCGEVFTLNNPMIELFNEKTVVNFFINKDNSFSIANYDIKLDNGYLLSRSYLINDMVMFSIGNNDRHFLICVRGIDKLDNELDFLNYLMNLDYPLDIISIYKDLCNISLGNDISKYIEITLGEAVKKGNEWEDINLITLSNGNLVDFVINIGDKIISCNQDGDYSYKIIDDDLDISINNYNGRQVVNISSSSEKIMDGYIDGLLRYDISSMKSEVEKAKKLVREKITKK